LVAIAESGELAEHTRMGREGKVRRLLDLRQSGMKPDIRPLSP
ncbi:MAG: hypothetical protein K0S56_2443, partial [Microvirga sp.]|nr:hypothetical protein [Microvirga sp.]